MKQYPGNSSEHHIRRQEGPCVWRLLQGVIGKQSIENRMDWAHIVPPNTITEDFWTRGSEPSEVNGRESYGNTDGHRPEIW